MDNIHHLYRPFRNKISRLGRKQVWRRFAPDGRMTGEVLSVADDEQQGEPLIEPVMRDSKHPAPRPTLADIRAHAADNLGRLPTQLQRSEPVESYPIEIAEALMNLADEVDRRLASKQEQRQ